MVGGFSADLGEGIVILEPLLCVFLPRSRKRELLMSVHRKEINNPCYRDALSMCVAGQKAQKIDGLEGTMRDLRKSD